MKYLLSSTKFTFLLTYFSWPFWILSGLGIALRLLIPANIMSNYQHDDYLGVRLANSILDGNWLGSWSNVTLAKPPGYSIFLAVTSFLSINPLLAVFLIHLVSCLVFVSLIPKISRGEISRNSFSSYLIFSFLVFNPMFFGGQFSRIYRTNLNTVLLELLVVLGIAFSFRLQTDSMQQNFWTRKWKMSSKQRAFYLSICTLMGLIYSLAYLNRTETFWILVAPIISISIACTYFLVKGKTQGIYVKKVLSGLIVSMFVFFCSYQIPIKGISLLNNYAYGFNGVEDFYTGNFAKAIANWQRVKTGVDPRPFILVSKGQREAVYKISPSARIIKPALEAIPAEGSWNWKSNNCSSTGVCDESGVWFPWEIRDAAISHAGIKTANEFQKFFGALADEIDSGCETGQLSCGISGFNPSAKSVENIPIRQLVDTTIAFITSLQNMEQTGTVLRPAVGDNVDELLVWNRVTNSDRLVTEGEYQVWQALGSPVLALNNFYKALLTFFPILLIGFFYFFWSDKRYRLQKYIAFTLLLSALIYSAIVAVTQISAGFQIEKQLYLIPAQPIFILAFVLMATLVLGKLKSHNVK